jgi:hypothetical protein
MEDSLVNENAEQRIKAYQREAQDLQSTPPSCACPSCSHPSPGYKPQSRRQRRLGLLEKRWVHWFSIVLMRWKCLVCRRSFTWYPSFCRPYKHYVLHDMMALSKRYAENDTATYRSVSCCIGSGEQDDQLSPTTLWRWLGDFGACEQLLQRGLRLLQRKDPELTLHRQMRPVATRKWRREPRRQCLESARWLMVVCEAFSRLFGRSLFPRLRNAGC